MKYLNLKSRAVMRIVAIALGIGLHGINVLAASDLVVGQVVPLTGSLSATGSDLVLGAQVYFRYINANGGINGSQIRHVIADDGYRMEDTLRLTRDMIKKEHPVALIGFAGTANIAELAKQGVLADARIALIAPYTGSESLRGPNDKNIFHIRAGYADEAEKMVRQLITLSMKKIGVFYQNDGFGEAGLKGVVSAMEKFGLKPVVTASYERNTDNVVPAAELISKADPDAVIMFSVNRAAAGFATAFRKFGGHSQLLNVSVVNAGELVKLAGNDIARGIGITQVVPYPYSGLQPVTREYRKIFAQYAPAGSSISYTSFEAFIGAKVLVEGIRRAGNDTSSARVIESLAALGSYDAGGFAVNFSQNNRIGSREVDLTVIGTDGRLLH